MVFLNYWRLELSFVEMAMIYKVSKFFSVLE